MNFFPFFDLIASRGGPLWYLGFLGLPLLGVVGAGPAGGRIGKRADSDLPEFVNGLLDGSVTPGQLRERVKSYSTPEKVSLVLNNSCNLACKHCYLQVPRLNGEPLSALEWETLTASILDGGSPFVSLAGKEIFLSKRNVELLARIDAINEERGHPSRLGVVTNGTLIEPYRPLLKRLHLDYLDISIDGAAEDHDAIRGTGAFEAARPNVEWAAREMPAPFFLSMTVHRRNFERIGAALAAFQGLGVSNVGLGFMVPTRRTDPALTLGTTEIEATLSNLSALGSIPLVRPMKVVFELNTHTPEGLVAFLRSPWFVGDAIESDRFDNPWIEHRLKNGLLLQFKFLVMPSSASRTARITPEGHYLALDDVFETGRYVENSLANVRDHGLDYAKILRAARQHPRFHEILDDYERQILPELRRAYSEGFRVNRRLAA